jgi:hypothetical protein
MTNDKSLTSIRRNGGWCQLYRMNFYGGRLLFYNNELSFIEKFDLATDSLKGYVVVLNNTKQRLIKAYWIKKILRIKRKSINDGSIPSTIFAETVTDFLQKLISSKELLLLRFLEGTVKGFVSNFSELDLTISIFSSEEDTKQITVLFSQIICLELGTPIINKLS